MWSRSGRMAGGRVCAKADVSQVNQVEPVGGQSLQSKISNPDKQMSQIVKDKKDGCVYY
jgi:hypothetical protein